jgi:hypothetical protein
MEGRGVFHFIRTLCAPCEQSLAFILKMGKDPRQYIRGAGQNFVVASMGGVERAITVASTEEDVVDCITKIGAGAT